MSFSIFLSVSYYNPLEEWLCCSLVFRALLLALYQQFIPFLFLVLTKTFVRVRGKLNVREIRSETGE